MGLEVFREKLCFVFRPGSTVNCIYGSSPPGDPGQIHGQKPSKNPGGLFFIEISFGKLSDNCSESRLNTSTNLPEAPPQKTESCMCVFFFFFSIFSIMPYSIDRLFLLV